MIGGGAFGLGVGEDPVRQAKTSSKPDGRDVHALGKDGAAGREELGGLQGVRRVAPTVEDVQFSLDKAGYQAERASNGQKGSSGDANGGRMSASRGSQASGDANRKGSSGGVGGNSAWKRVEPIRVTQVHVKEVISPDGVTVNLNPDAVSRNVVKLERALIGNLLGRKFPFHFLSAELSRRWEQFGPFQMIMTGEDNFICIFDRTEDRDAVLMGGPWFVAGQVIGMDKWTPEASSSSLAGLSTPIWIRLPHLPLAYWDDDSIGRIATMIGNPLWIDAHTSSWGRCSYARVCVRINLAQKLLPGVMINGLQGQFFQPVEYEGLSFVCFSCGRVGHKDSGCPEKEQARRTNVGDSAAKANSSSKVERSAPRADRDGSTAKGKKIMEDVRGSSDSAGGSGTANLAVGTDREVIGSVKDLPQQDELGPWILVQHKRRPNSKRLAGKPNGDKQGGPKPQPKGQTGPNLGQEPVNARGGLNADANTAAKSAKPVESVAPTESNPSWDLVVHGKPPLPKLSGGHGRLGELVVHKDAPKLISDPPLTRKRRKQSLEITGGGDASPSVEI